MPSHGWRIKRKIVNQAGVWAVVTTNFNLLPQLSPANNIVQQEIKNAKSLSEASRILEEAVENYPCDNKSTLNFCYVYPIVLSEKLPNLPEEIHGFTTSVTISQNAISFGVNSCPKTKIRRDGHQADG